jgi:hypothetical protein
LEDEQTGTDAGGRGSRQQNLVLDLPKSLSNLGTKL